MAPSLAFAQPTFVSLGGGVTDYAFYETGNGPAIDLNAPVRKEAALDAFEAFIAQYWSQYGLAGPSDTFPFIAAGYMDEDPEAVLPPGTTTKGISVLRVVPIVNGTIWDAGGYLQVGFLNNKLLFVVGRPRAKAATTASYSSLLAGTAMSYASVKALAAANCPAEFAEREIGVEFIQFASSLRYYEFFCGPSSWRMKSTSGLLAESYVAEDAWQQSTAYFNARDDGNLLSTSGNEWFNSSLMNKTYPNLRVDSQWAYTTNCTFRLSISGAVWVAPQIRSAKPWPVLYRNSSTNVHTHGGNCADGGSAFMDSNPGSTRWHIQNVYTALERGAHHARRDFNAGLFSPFRSPENLPYYAVLAETGACTSNLAAGSYQWWRERLCVDPDTYSGTWHAPLHEYGHYIADQYEMQHNSGCPSSAIREGSADALSTSLMHRHKLGETVLSSADGDTIFRNGPGTGIFLAGSLYSPPVHAISTPCDSPYVKGFVLPQLMWKLINDRRCAASYPCSTITRISSSIRMPVVARQAFTIAMTNSSHTQVVVFARLWRDVLRRLLTAEGLLSNPVLTQVNAVFAEHGI